MSSLPVWVQCRLEDLAGDHELPPLARQSVFDATDRLVDAGTSIENALRAIEIAFTAGMTTHQAAANAVG